MACSGSGASPGALETAVPSVLITVAPGAPTPDAGAPTPDAGAPPPDAGAPTPDAAQLGAPAPKMVANIVYSDIPANLIVNGDFEDYEDANVPAGWSVDEIYGWRGMYTPTAGWRGTAVQFVRNAQGRHFLAQDVAVTPGRRYTVQMVFQVVATDSRRGGLYVLDPADGTTIASDSINRPSNGWRIASATFDSGQRTHVSVEIGYPSGMNGTAIYDAVSMFEDDPALHDRYQTSYRDVMRIADQPVDDLVPQVADYVTTLLAAPAAERAAHQAAYAAVLPYYLYQFLSASDDAGRGAWCQRTALAVAELLAMYGVQTRQIHVATPQHEFLEYFDGKKWVVFDAYYGIRYVLAGARLGVAEVVRAGIRQASIEVPTHEHVFFLELGYLIPIWDAGAFTQGIEMP
ncbi:MAG TPA: hypothetical protein VHW23_13625 [Kofleriaceae bacterium]|nr:hypothetical protein [Kofleriaceae bacterium]